MKLEWLLAAPHHFKFLTAHELNEIVLFITGFTCQQLKLKPSIEITESQYQQTVSFFHRLEAGEPVGYILGYQYFWQHEFLVSPAVLIPRPDTEHLISAVKEIFKSNQTINIIDLGTGSGCIGITLALEFPKSNVTATDWSTDALQIAVKNAKKLNCQNITFKKQQWWQNEQYKYHLVVSNPPYIDESDVHLPCLLDEPISALTAKEKGLADLQQIISGAPSHLYQNGYLVVEHGYDQGEAVRLLFQESGFRNIRTIQDFGQNDRITIGQWVF